MVAMLTLAGCSKTGTEQPSTAAEATAPQAKTPSLSLAQGDLFTVESGPIEQSIELTGTLQAQEKAQVRSKTSGNVLAVLAQEGQAVQKGAVLVRIDPTEAKLRVQEREAFMLAQQAQAQQTKTQYDNNIRLHQQGFVSETALLNAKASHDAALAQVGVAQAQLNLARQQLADTEVRAPFAGTLGPVPVQTGSKVSVDSPLFDVLNLRQMEMRAEVSPDEIPRLKVGQQAQLVLSSNQPSLKATLSRISPGSVQGSRTVSVFLAVQNPDQMLRSGQFATARLQLGAAQQGLLIPKTAIRELQGQAAVYVVTPQNTIKAQTIETGSEVVKPDTGTAFVEVKKGLQEKDTIVGVNLGPLQDGAAISIQTLQQ